MFLFLLSMVSNDIHLPHVSVPVEHGVKFVCLCFPMQNISTVEATGDSESESEDSDGEKHRRGRFKSERSSMISVSKVKSRTDIPDTLGTLHVCMFNMMAGVYV